MTLGKHLFAPDMPDADRALFLKRLRHDLLNTARPMVEIPAWIDEDAAEEGFELPGSLRENLGLLSTYGSRLNQMIIDILTYVHIEGDDNGEALLSKTLADLTPDLHPDFELITDLEHDKLPIQQALLKTLLDALLANAVKHHDRAGGKIKLWCKRVGTQIRLTVTDDGPGIEPQHLEKIFEPLTTLNSRDQIEGSGMGLAIVHRIASACGAKVQAFSRENQRGTCIAVWFS